METYIIKKSEIEAMEGLQKTHFLNKNAQRVNKSLGDLTGLTGLGFHIIEVPPGKNSPSSGFCGAMAPGKTAKNCQSPPTQQRKQRRSALSCQLKIGVCFLGFSNLHFFTRT